MAEPVINPLTADHLDQIQKALQVARIAEQQIAMAKSAGLDVSQQESALRDAKAKLLQLKNVYFPNQ